MPSIRKRGDKWQVQIRIKDAPPLAKSFTLKQDAERWAREMEAQGLAIASNVIQLRSAIRIATDNLDTFSLTFCLASLLDG